MILISLQQRFPLENQSLNWFVLHNYCISPPHSFSFFFFSGLFSEVRWRLAWNLCMFILHSHRIIDPIIPTPFRAGEMPFPNAGWDFCLVSLWDKQCTHGHNDEISVAKTLLIPIQGRGHWCAPVEHPSLGTGHSTSAAVNLSFYTTTISTSRSPVPLCKTQMIDMKERIDLYIFFP